MSATAITSIAPCVVPADLTELDQWVLWKFESRNGKPTKVPHSVKLRRASVMNPSDLAEWDRARDVLLGNPRFFENGGGLGFVFHRSDPFVGIDLDRCLAYGTVKIWARGIVERFSDTYMEISPSGAGLKIWARGALAANVPGVPVCDGSIEMYDHARFFTVTGRRFLDAPLEIEEHAADLTALHARLTNGIAGKWPVEPLRGGRIPHGQQHSTLVSLAGTLRRRRVCDAAILACLLSVNQHQCEKPGPLENIERIVRSTRGWEADRRE